MRLVSIRHGDWVGGVSERNSSVRTSIYLFY